MNKRFIKKITSFLFLVAMTITLAACGNKEEGQSNGNGSENGSGSDKKIINIGVTYAPGTINPLSPSGEVATAVTGLMFLPLVEINSDNEFVPMLAESITTEDNKTFTIKIDKNATWSDGQPVDADDLIYTIRQIANPAVASIYSYVYALVEGFDDYGYLADVNADIPGVVKVDEKTVTLTMKEQVSLVTFQNSIGRYLWTVPQHMLEEIAPENLVVSEFFQNPSVTNGPFKLLSYNRDHFVQLQANKDYFKGAPKIDQLNFNVMQGSQIYPRLQSGEIDFNLPTLGIIPASDYENIKALSNVTTFLEEPIANQYVYINGNTLADANVRLALVYAMNRDQIVNDLLQGNGEVINGFFTTYSPYYDETLGKTEYNPEKAKELLAAANWDSNKEIVLSVSSGDDTLAQAANIMVANLNAVGVKAKVKMTDFATLLDELYAQTYDLAILQYSFTPVDPYPDFSFLIGPGNIINYNNDKVNELFAQVKSEDDKEKIKDLYAQINKIAEVEVPMFSAYATRSLVAVSNRVTGVSARAFGSFINVQDWDIKK